MSFFKRRSKECEEKPINVTPDSCHEDGCDNQPIKNSTWCKDHACHYEMRQTVDDLNYYQQSWYARCPNPSKISGSCCEEHICQEDRCDKPRVSRYNLHTYVLANFCVDHICHDCSVNEGTNVCKIYTSPKHLSIKNFNHGLYNNPKLCQECFSKRTTCFKCGSSFKTDQGGYSYLCFKCIDKYSVDTFPGRKISDIKWCITCKSKNRGKITGTSVDRDLLVYVHEKMCKKKYYEDYEEYKRNLT